MSKRIPQVGDKYKNERGYCLTCGRAVEYPHKFCCEACQKKWWDRSNFK